MTKRKEWWYEARISGRVPADSRDAAEEAIEDLRGLHGDGAGDWIIIDSVYVSLHDIQPVTPENTTAGA